MAQSVVTVRLNGQPYQMGAGQVRKPISSPRQRVDAIITSLKAEAGQLEIPAIGDGALILADQKHIAQNAAGKPISSSNGASQTSLDSERGVAGCPAAGDDRQAAYT